VTRFAVIGDYGVATSAEAEVARLVRGFDPEFVVTTGDNNYPSGSADTIDANVGQFYHSFIYPYRGKYGDGATENRFFPTLGNHDWYTPNAQPYLDYFELPGNERYYDVVRGNVHYFAIDSDVNEPDGVTSTSVQGQWCEATARASTAPFRVAAMHHPPYSSGSHGNTSSMQWPYRAWGFDLVLGGHDHTYERIELGGVTYVVNGLGGNHTYGFRTPVPGSVARDNLKQGALFVEASATKLVGRFVDIDGRLVDVFALDRR
jgi:tartrate-resistant acid phosphatase type 5